MSVNRIEIGRCGEAHALAHYERQGYSVLATNVRTRFGEIDLIVRSPSTLVICEVRTRVAGRGNALESFNRRKVRQVRRMAAHWLATNPPVERFSAIRLDAAAVAVDRTGALLALDVLEGAL